jgi:hypothetical protein
MIELSMGEDDGIDGLEIVREQRVAPARFIPRALLEPKVQQDAKTIEFDQMGGAGDGAISAAELDPHGIEPKAGI